MKLRVLALLLLLMFGCGAFRHTSIDHEGPKLRVAPEQPPRCPQMHLHWREHETEDLVMMSKTQWYEILGHLIELHKYVDRMLGTKPTRRRLLVPMKPDFGPAPPRPMPSFPMPGEPKPKRKRLSRAI